MSYLVLARKYRPQQFDDVIGQAHITGILKKAIASNRVHHAYLFCGPRGVGKTSCARILAKALNCEKGATPTPCGACPSCVDITKGSSFDVLEIDGASNRGIDEIRALRENVKFAANSGRFKIYIVDEVHMLTTEAFNALLKTLEEPPSHVKFVFATTEPHKVPATIISRCQRFDFKRVAVQMISERLGSIAATEKISIEPTALFAISKAAQGSLRDALGILDQISALKDRGIESADVFSMLGLVETENLFAISDALSKKDCGAALTALDGIIEQGKDLKQLLRDLTEHFRNLMVVKIGGKSLEKLLDYPMPVKEKLAEQMQGFSIEEILRIITALINAQETARVTETMRLSLEIAFATLTYTSATSASVKPGEAAKPVAGSSIHSVGSAQSKPQPSGFGIVKNQRGQINAPVDEPQHASSSQGDSSSTPLNRSLDLPLVVQLWEKLTYAVSRQKMSLATYLQEVSPHGVEGNKIIIGMPQSSAFHKECLEQTENVKFIQDIFSEVLQTPISVRYVLVENFEKIKNDPAVDSALDAFGGEVVNRWYEE